MCVGTYLRVTVRPVGRGWTRVHESSRAESISRVKNKVYLYSTPCCPPLSYDLTDRMDIKKEGERDRVPHKRVLNEPQKDPHRDSWAMGLPLRVAAIMVVV